MAKTKVFAVDVEYTIRRTLFVKARRPNGAREALLTNEGWQDAIRYLDDSCLPFSPNGVAITEVREETGLS